MSGLTDVMGSILRITDSILSYTSSNHPDVIHVSELPRYSKQDEMLDKHHVSVDVSNSEAPLDSLKTALKKMFVDSDQSSRILQRWPGIVVYNDAQPELQELIALLNQQKTEFKNLVDSIARSEKSHKMRGKQDVTELMMLHDGAIRKNLNPAVLRDRKWDLVHTSFSMLVTLYVYRKVYFETGQINAAYFNWLRAPNVKKVSKSNLINHLQWQLKQAESSAISHYDAIEIEKALTSVSSSSRSQYIQRTPQPPRPNVVFHFTDDRKPKAFYCGLPIFLFNQNDHPFSLKQLKSFSDSASKDRKHRSDAKQLSHLHGHFYYE